MSKERLDTLLVARNIFNSRERAKAEIMAGKVLVDNIKIDKAGTMVNALAEINLIGQRMPYVSRGGLKLEKAIKVFALDFTDKTVLDIGASTGGFTDCSLQNGAKKVCAVDVGYGQLAWSLVTDPRVINLERTNIKYLERDKLVDFIDIVTIDVAFISLEKVLPVVKKLLLGDYIIVALVKPQFEAGKEKVGKKGVVRDPAVHREVLEKIITVSQNLEYNICGLDYSPIKGPEGNIEYLLYLGNEKIATDSFDIAEIVALAHHL